MGPGLGSNWGAYLNPTEIRHKYRFKGLVVGVGVEIFLPKVDANVHAETAAQLQDLEAIVNQKPNVDDVPTNDPWRRSSRFLLT